MPCFYPLAATQLRGGAIVVHRRTPGIDRKATSAAFGRDLKLPCGRCIGCRLQRTQHWAIRCLHESQRHQHNAFLTLTYADAPPSLSKEDHQNFVKNLRYHCGKVRYFMCGEYGEQLQRPHYHYLLFGYGFPDRYYFKTSSSGERLYRSPELESIWTHGHAWIGDVTYESCAYVAAYVTKKITGARALEHYRRTDEAGNDYWLTPEFNYMSRRPGIGKDWWETFNQDVTTGDTVILPNGIKAKPPRYYDKLLEVTDPVGLEVLKLRREIRGEQLVDDNTPARLRDKEIIAYAKQRIKTRQLEAL